MLPSKTELLPSGSNQPSSPASSTNSSPTRPTASYYERNQRNYAEIERNPEIIKSFPAADEGKAREGASKRLSFEELEEPIGSRRIEDEPSNDPAQEITQEEIEQYSRIKCTVCGNSIPNDEIDLHSRTCSLEAVPNHKIFVDKWSIACGSMTAEEQRTFLVMRRKEELHQVNTSIMLLH